MHQVRRDAQTRENFAAVDAECDREGLHDLVAISPEEAPEVLALGIGVAWSRFAMRDLGALLMFEDLDLDHGKLTVHRSVDRNRGGALKATKAEAPRTFTVESAVLPLLRAMHGEARGAGRVVPRMPRHRDLAEQLRRWLKVAGVTRADLFVSDSTRINLRWHDLRASAVTWMAVRGDNPALIMARVGHEDYETLRKYLRQAEALVANFGDVFPPLPASLLGNESSRRIVPANRPKSRKLATSLRGGRDSNPRPPA